MRVAAGALALLSLTGCAAVGDLTGAVAGLATGAATANPAVGIAVAIAVRSGANEVADRVARSRRNNEQAAIAGAVAPLREGGTAAWAVDQRVVGDAYGDVRVVRVFANALTTCKEIVFSIRRNPEDEPQWFTTTACDTGGEWRWAAAEPAVARWVNLQ